jgi:hypothetical protein
VEGPIGFNKTFAALRQAARARAAAYLRERGFVEAAPDAFSGSVDSLDGTRRIAVRVSLPAEFPDALPVIEAPGLAVTDRRAHVERSTRLCIAREGDVLLDADRPEDIVRDAMIRARAILFEGTPADQQRQLEQEFSSYWRDAKVVDVVSICRPRRLSGEVFAVTLDKPAGRLLVAATAAEARDWASLVGAQTGATRPAYFVRLQSLFVPPRFDEVMRLRELLRIIKEHAPPGLDGALQAWLKQVGVPAVIVLSGPLSSGESDIVFAAEVSELTDKPEQRALRGFRKHTVPTWRKYEEARSLPVARRDATRMDPEYVIERGGGDVSLRTKGVAIIGCGAVGSAAAPLVAASGFGSIVLIDKEVLESGNIHRHELGAADLGQPKAEALAATLKRRFPHVAFRPLGKKVQDVLSESPELVTGCDVAIIALGDETLERRLNQFLGDRLPRVQVWLEPFGVGGHVLATGLAGKKGCFGCLLRSDETWGIINRASLVAPGQDFTRTLAGCAGAFTPFGALDAQAAAIEAVREAMRLCTEPHPEPRLTSWAQDKSRFTSAGYRLSERGEKIPEGTRWSETDFGRPECEVCRG